MSAANKELVLHFYDELFGHGNLDVVDKFIGTEYVQHNPHAPNGAEALRRFVTGFRARFPRLRHTVEHAVAEDDLVLLHSRAELEPGTSQAVVDIFRVRDGKIVEHWDVLQDVPDSTVSGHDMFSTLSAPGVPSPDAAESKRVAVALFDEVIGGRDVTAWDRYVAGPFYQHNPQQADGAAAAREMFTATFAAHPELTVDVKRVITDGDLVAFHHHFRFAPGDLGFAVIDLFRVQNGKVVEHWDVVQPVPAASANDNTMF